MSEVGTDRSLVRDQKDQSQEDGRDQNQQKEDQESSTALAKPDNQEDEEVEKIKRLMQIQQSLGVPFEVHGKVHHFSPRSLFCLTEKNRCRQLVVWLITWNIFDHFITVVILVNSVILAMRDYGDRLYASDYGYVSEKNIVLDQIGKVLSLIFLAECVLKVIGMGFVFHKTSYLRDSWNKLDFFVVCASFFDFAGELFPELDSFSSLKVLRTFRILRPLRSINKVKKMKMLINSLLKSIPGLLNVMIFLFFIMSIFGIFATHQFKGAQYQRCRTTNFTTMPLEIDGEMSVQKYWPKQSGAEWLCRDNSTCTDYLKYDKQDADYTFLCGTPSDVKLNYDQDLADRDELIMFDIINFNNFAASMRSIFVAISLEGWILMLYNYSDANSPGLVSVFFIFLVIFGAFFALNLVLAEVIESYYSSQAEESLKKEMQAAEEIKLKKLQDVKDYVAQQKTLANDAAQRSKDDAEIANKQEKKQEITENSFPPISQRSNRSNADLAQQIEAHQRSQESPRAAQGDAAANNNNNSQSELLPQQELVNVSYIDQSENKLPSSANETREVVQRALIIIDPQDEEEDGEEQEKEEQIHEVNARKRANNNRYINCFYQLVTASSFNCVIVLLILVNTACLAWDSYGISETETQVLLYLNITLTWIFFSEMILKMIGLGLENYFKDNFNVFDCVVVMVSIVDFTISVTIDEDEIGEAADGLQALRALRLLRIIKLARSWTELQEILRKTAMSLKDIGYFSVLLFLFMFIISLLGMELFANSCRFDTDGNLITDIVATKAAGIKKMIAPRENFDSIWNALITVFIIILGEDWPGVMYNYVRVYDLLDSTGAYGWAISLFFILSFMIGNFLLLSLFVAILLQNFEEKEVHKDEDDEEECVDKKLSDSAMYGSQLNSSEFPVVQKKSFHQKMGEIWIVLQYEYIAAFGTTQAINQAGHVRKKQTKALEYKYDQVQRAKDGQVLPCSSSLELQFQIAKDANDLDKNLEQANRNAQSNEKTKKLGGSEKHFNTERKIAKKLRTINSDVLPDNIYTSHPDSSPDVPPPSSPRSQPVTIGTEPLCRPTIANSLAHIELHLSVNSKTTEKKKNKREMKGNSLFVLSTDNCLRKFCNSIVTCWLFDWMILIFITISTINLAIESPLDDPDSQKVTILGYIDYLMTSIFIVEALLKIIAYGFLFNGKVSYLRDGWCILDFFIVLISIAGIMFKEYNLTYLKVLRMLRVMKPLRMLTMMRSLRLAIVSLFKSIPDIVNLLLICTFFIFLLAILSMTLFKGKFYRCNMDSLNLDDEDKELLITNKEDCLNYGGEWANRDLNFDTTGQAFVTLFTVQSTEGWIGVMWNSVDAVGIDKQPIINKNFYFVIYYIIVIVLLCMLFLNLFVGVVCETFNKESENLSFNHLLGNDTKDWIQVQLMSYSAKPQVRLIENLPQVNCLRNLCIKVSNNPAFDNIIMVCILLNTVALAVVWYEMPQSVVTFLERLNIMFMVIFTVEAIIKLIALKSAYFKDNWNCFDFVVVIGSLAAVTLSLFPNVGIDMNMQSTMVRILRVLRVLRIVKRAQKLQIIFETLVAAAPAMGSLGILLLLLQFMYGIIGMQLFAMVKLEGELNKHANFKNFNNAFLLLMRCATGEGWNALMFDTARTYSIIFQCDENPTYEKIQANNEQPNGCGMPRVATIYFISFQIIVSQVFLNLFIAIVVDTFIAMKNAFDLPIKQMDIDMFIELWKQYDPQGSGYIKTNDLELLMLDLVDEKTSFFEDDLEQITNTMMRRNLLIYLEIPIHKDLKYVMFYDVLSIFSRYKCEVSHKLIQKRRQELKAILFIEYKFRGCKLTPEMEKHLLNLRMRKDEQCLTFFANMFCTKQVDDRVELKIDINKAAKNVLKRFSTTMDYRPNPNDPDDDQIELWTTKHFHNASKIIYHWRLFVKNRQEEKDQEDVMDQIALEQESAQDDREGENVAPIARVQIPASKDSKSSDGGVLDDDDNVGELPDKRVVAEERDTLQQTAEVQLHSQEFIEQINEEENTNRNDNNRYVEPTEKSVKKQPR